ncbi:transposase, partial [Mesorhizobium ciceri]|uniref:transposase n=1 Tax=Mesorhizobium ciceri TaxID=39645 RepID=UPI003D35A76B
WLEQSYFNEASVFGRPGQLTLPSRRQLTSGTSARHQVEGHHGPRRQPPRDLEHGCFLIVLYERGTIWWALASNAEADFHGQKRSNDTHGSTTDPDARLYRKGKGKETKLCFIGRGLMENRHGLLVDACLTFADGHAERAAALHMIEPRADRSAAITLGADEAYDAEDFINELRSMRVTPHVAQNTNGRSSAIDGRTTRHGGYAVSQRIRKRIEEAFGWIKTIAGQEKTKLRGRDRVGWAFTFAAAAYNLVRLPKLMAAPT